MVVLNERPGVLDFFSAEFFLERRESLPTPGGAVKSGIINAGEIQIFYPPNLQSSDRFPEQKVGGVEALAFPG